MTEERWGDWAEGGRRLCFFRASRTTPRYVLAERGSDGWESHLTDAEKEKDEVVGRTKGKGMVKGFASSPRFWEQ